MANNIRITFTFDRKDAKKKFRGAMHLIGAAKIMAQTYGHYAGGKLAFSDPADLEAYTLITRTAMSVVANPSPKEVA